MQNFSKRLEPVESLSEFPKQVVEAFHNKDLLVIIESFWCNVFYKDYYEDEYRDGYSDEDYYKGRYSDDFKDVWSEIFYSTQSIMSYYCPAGPTKFLADSTNFWHLGILRSLTGT